MRIGFVLPETGHWGLIRPQEWYSQPLGGRERNTILLARELAQRATVHMFTAVEREAEADGIVWRPVLDWDARPETYDAIIVLEHARFCWPRRAKVQIVWLQCADHIWGGADDNFVVDYTAFLTGWHEWYVRKECPWITADRSLQIPNVHDHLTPDWKRRRTPNSMIFMSSPDRGLWQALTILDLIRRELPDATLRVLYGAQEFADTNRWNMFRLGEAMLTVAEEHPGALYLGKCSYHESIEALKSSAMLLYPCDSWRSSETFCTVTLEACATRTPMMISNAGCLEQQWGDAGFVLRRPIDVEAWAMKATQLLQDVGAARAYCEKQAELADKYSVSHVGQRVYDLLCGLLGEQDRASFVEEWALSA